MGHNFPNESIFFIFSSNFLCEIPVGGSKGLCDLRLVSAMLFHSMMHEIKQFDKI